MKFIYPHTTADFQKHLMFFFLVLTLIRSQSVLFAQVEKTNTTKTDTLSSRILSKKVNQNFGVIATGQSEASNLANYGSFEPVNGEFKFNFFGPIGKIENKYVPFFSISASGKVLGENSSALFNNSKLNSGISANLKLHLPIRRSSAFSGNQEEDALTLLNQFKIKSGQNPAIDSLSYDSIYYVRLRQNYLARQNKNVQLKSQLIHRYDSLSYALGNLSKGNDSILAITDSLLSISRTIKQITNDSIRNQKDIMALANTSMVMRKAWVNRIIYEDSLKLEKYTDSILNNFDLKTLSLLWFSPVANIGRNKYYCFNSELEYADQIQKKIFTTYSLGFEFNFIGYLSKRKPVIGPVSPRPHVVNIGLVYQRRNNLDDLSATELNDTRKYTSLDSSRTLSTKYNIYTDSITEIFAWRVYANYYYYFGRQKNLALHIFPEIEIRNTKQNPWGLGLGIIAAYKNRKDNTAVNIELYGKLIDISNSLNLETNKFYNRNVIGVNFGIPLYYLNSTKK